MNLPLCAGGDPQRQSCKVCGHRDGFNFHVPDELWRQVVPTEFRKRVVCLTCFDGLAARSEIKYAAHISTLYFIGDGAAYEFTARVIE